MKFLLSKVYWAIVYRVVLIKLMFTNVLGWILLLRRLLFMKDFDFLLHEL